MPKKMSSILCTGIIALALAACGAPESGKEAAAGANESGSASTERVDVSYASLFQKSVFLGDSLIEGLSYHDVLDEANVIGNAGATAEFAQDEVDNLASRHPDHVFILLGGNDLYMPVDNPKEYFLTQYAKLIGKIKGKLPNVKIRVLSLTPVTAEAEREEPRYQNIGEFNAGLKELAAKEQVEFIDLTPIFTNNPDLFDTDGVHFKAEFYPLLLDDLKDYLKK
ncbi:GDSL-type esterase/lipase family protein [Brevibacillus massiliensis]|jgi:lysophospholipase L1-like esterase|uniref:GDSL-type esterase/lipase family protein n=1 Tax=Brevibacillus massiliensis TaxID=1118054 RepID=UPI00031C9927|nr:GDSL-type esterase/lipase family protein [Brevibacillus massiliensis]